MTSERGTGTGRGRRAPAAALAGLGLAALLAGCVTEVRREPRPAERPSLSLTLRSDRAEYAPGAPVELVLELRNRGAIPVSMVTPTSQLYEFVVDREGAEVWRWSAGKAFLPQITEVVLAPGQNGVYRVLWDGRGLDGRPLAPGRYTVTGVWIGGEQFGLVPLRLPLTIR
jgi:hypothetical protein